MAHLPRSQYHCQNLFGLLAASREVSFVHQSVEVWLEGLVIQILVLQGLGELLKLRFVRPKKSG